MRPSLPFAHAAGALEPGEALALERAARRDPALAARLAQARRALDGDDPPGFGPWFHGAGAALGELHLDAGPWQPGDRLPLLLDGALPPDARLEARLRTRAGERVLSPVDGRHLRLSELRRTAEGAWALDLILGQEPGLHRLRAEVRSADGAEILASCEVAVRVVGEVVPSVE